MAPGFPQILQRPSKSTIFTPFQGKQVFFAIYQVAYQLQQVVYFPGWQVELQEDPPHRGYDTQQ